jgi:hypothetical protein
MAGDRLLLHRWLELCFVRYQKSASSSELSQFPFLFDHQVSLTLCARVFIRAQSDERRVPQIVSDRPVQKCNLCYRLRLDPHTLVHFFDGEPLSPSPCRLLWQVGKWTLLDLKRLKFAELPRAV